MIVAPLLHIWLVPKYRIVGSALSIVGTQWIMTISLLLYLYYHPNVYHTESWPRNPFTISFLKESLFQWKATCQYLSLSLGGVLSLSEWWHWEVLTFIAGSFGAVLLAAHSIAYSLVPLLFMIPLGISIGLAKRIGHMLAEQQPMRARTMAMGTVVVVTIMATLVAIVLKVDGRNIIRIFSHDPCSLCFVVCSSQRWGVGCAMAHYHIIILFVVYLVKHDCSYH